MTNKQKSRKGKLTSITSVSVSKEFKEILERYNFSPTEVFRRGIAVMMHDMKIPSFQTKLNEERSIYVKEFLKNIDIETMSNRLEELKKAINGLKKELIIKED